MSKTARILISGGGTGGHIFPAISIANEIRLIQPDAQILFVGAIGKIEMEKVPQAGYPIIGLPIAGFERKFTFHNLVVVGKLLRSLWAARKIIKNFKPNVAVGVGGYASGPVMYIAATSGIPCILQEQNSFAGVTNRILASRVKRICTAYEGMEKFFPKEKIVLTGNPVRHFNFEQVNRNEALAQFNLSPDKKTILVLGGSGGARSINEAMLGAASLIATEKNLQVIWQTGKNYYTNYEAEGKLPKTPNLYVAPFIERMDLAYKAADIIISRAGAGTVSELCIVGKPSVLVPSPYVAEDHQTRNAMAMVSKNAALLVKDADTAQALVNETIALLGNEELHKKMSENCKSLALPNAGKEIAQIVLSYVK